MHKVFLLLTVIGCAAIFLPIWKSITYVYSDPLPNLSFALKGMILAGFAYFLFTIKSFSLFHARLISVYNTHVSFRWGNITFLSENPERMKVYVLFWSGVYLKTTAGHWLYLGGKNIKSAVNSMREAGYIIRVLSIGDHLLVSALYLSTCYAALFILELLFRFYPNVVWILVWASILVFLFFLFRRTSSMKIKRVKWLSFKMMKSLYLALICTALSVACFKHAFKPMSETDKKLIERWSEFEKFPNRTDLREIRYLVGKHGAPQQKNLIICAELQIFEKENGLAVEKFHDLRQQIRSYYERNRCPQSRVPASVSK